MTFSCGITTETSYPSSMPSINNLPSNKQQNIDMFKDGVSVPGLTLLYLSTNFRRTPSSLSSTRRTAICTYSSKKISLVVRPSYFIATMKKDITKIRGEETCRSIVGYDANALYLWALMQDMPTGWYTRRREERQFRPQQAQPFGQMAVQCSPGKLLRMDAQSAIRLMVVRSG